MRQKVRRKVLRCPLCATTHYRHARFKGPMTKEPQGTPMRKRGKEYVCPNCGVAYLPSAKLPKFDEGRLRSFS